MTLQEAQAIIGILVGVLVLAGALITGAVIVFTRRLASTRATEAGNTVTLLATQRDAYKLERDDLAAKMPKLEASLATLREEVGASKAIGELRGDVGKGFTQMVALIEGHEKRAQAADARQAEFNKKSADVLNEIGARLFIPGFRETT